MEDKYKFEREYIQKLIRNGEGQYLDFKFAVSDSRKIARSLVAFANSGGGTLLIGVKDNGKIAGIRSEEEIYMLDAASCLYTQPNVKYKLRLWQLDEEKQVLEVIVHKEDNGFFLAKDENDNWKAYLRFLDNNVIAGSVWEITKSKVNNKNKPAIVFNKSDQLFYSLISTKEELTFSNIMNLSGKSEEFLINKISDFIIIGLIEMKLTKSEVIFKITNKIFEL